MTNDIIMILASIAATGLFNGLVVFGAIKTKLQWLRRDTDLAHERIDKLQERLI